MDSIITKGQAACQILGEDITPDNRQKCKTIIDDSVFEAVYRYDTGNRCPMAIGKKVARRDPLTYIAYPDTPTDVSSSEEETPTPDERPLASDNEQESMGRLLNALSTRLNHFMLVDSSSQEDRGKIYKWKTKILGWNTHLVMIHSYSPRQIGIWLSKDGQFGTPEKVRTGSKLISAGIL